MSDQTENLQALCADCKSDLSRDTHKEDCPIILKQKADAAEKIRIENEKIEHDKKEAELEKQLAEELQKDKLMDDARKTLEENKNKAIEKAKIELKKKYAVLTKIRKLLPDEKFEDKDVLGLELSQIFELYNKVLKTVKDEKTNGKMQYDVSCPICNQVLGESSDINGAKILQKEHKKKEHPSSGTGNWIVLGLIFALVTAGAVGAYKMHKKKKKQDEGSA
ncbi:MAG: hypothetical protein ACYDAJ_02610 [Nitrosotalea sp.]